MADRVFTADLQRQGLPLTRKPVVKALEAKPDAAPISSDAGAEMAAALERIERRLAELESIKVAAAASASSETLTREIHELQARIQQTHIEIAALRHPKANQDRLVVAGEELGAIVSATEEATGHVLSACESIDRAASEIRTLTEDERLISRVEEILSCVVQIYEACNFQDITGQRISKVVRTLTFIEERVAAMIQTWGAEAFVDLPVPEDVAAADTEASLLNGPQSVEKAISQADIDAMFG